MGTKLAIVFLSLSLVMLGIFFTQQLPPISGKYPIVRSAAPLIPDSQVDALYVDSSGIYVAGFAARGVHIGCGSWATEYLRRIGFNGSLLWQKQLGTGACSNMTR